MTALACGIPFQAAMEIPPAYLSLLDAYVATHTP